MAKNRGERDDDAERESEEIADELDDADEEEFEDDVEDEDLADAELDPEKETVPPRRKSRGLSSARAADRGKVAKEQRRPGLIRRLGIFVREVVAELQKVIWPTRRELLTYTTVVVIFVAIMMTFVALLDLGFSKSLLWVFGGNPTETPPTP